MKDLCPKEFCLGIGKVKGAGLGVGEATEVA